MLKEKRKSSLILMICAGIGALAAIEMARQVQVFERTFHIIAIVLSVGAALAFLSMVLYKIAEGEGREDE